jgi:hypothetical protein
LGAFLFLEVPVRPDSNRDMRWVQSLREI